jgi:FtsH-binding integral membrane protein
MEEFHEEEKQQNSQNPQYNIEEINNQVDVQNSNEFSKHSIEETIRIGFIRKVYGIIALQLIITFFCCILTFFKSVSEFMISNNYLIFICLIIQIALIIIMGCSGLCSSKNLFKIFPYNYIFLILFTLSMGYIVATLCAVVDKTIVLSAIAMTLGITAALTLYAIKTENKFNLMHAFLFTFITMISELLLFFFFFNYQFYVTFELFVGLIIYCAYLIFDTQMIIDKFGNGYEIDDYIIAALNVYLDIIQIFIRILIILSKFKE